MASYCQRSEVPNNKKTVIAYGELLLKLNEHNYGLDLIAKAQGVISFTQKDFRII